ncbi:hypothetical protein TNCV_4524171 [Trichonephila clavipes]|nr:hypothetical protein TNCV_4524171 [Trichonephila clavipes]
MDRECRTNSLNFTLSQCRYHLCHGPTFQTNFQDIQASWAPRRLQANPCDVVLNANGRELGQCPFCNQTTCHRWIAVQGMCAILHQPINPIFHS